MAVIKNFQVKNGLTVGSGGSASLPAFNFLNSLGTGIYSPATNQLGITTGGNDRLRIDSSGRILLNTTSTNANNNPKLIIQNNSQPLPSGGPDAAIMAVSGLVGYSLSIGAYDSGTPSSSYTWISSVRSSDSFYDINNVVPLSFRIADREAFRISTNLRVGIGTTTPSERLHINSTARIDGGLNPYLILNDGTNTGYLQISSGLLNLNHNTSISLSPNGSERARVTSTGIGIGTTNPNRLLHVNSSGANPFVTITGNTTSLVGYLFGDSDADSQGQVIYNNSLDVLYFVSNNGERLRLDSNGQIEISLPGSASTPALAWLNDQNTGIYSPNLDEFGITTNGVGRFLINSIGNVGIGTTTPTSTLTVNGTGTFTSVGIGTTTPTNTLTVNGIASFTQISVGNTTGLVNQSIVNTGTGVTWAYAGGQLYELDDISSSCDGIKNTFIPQFNYEKVIIPSPFNLLITVDGVIQSAYIDSSECVWQSNLLCSNAGYTLDGDGNIKFTESLPVGSEVLIKTVSGVANTTSKTYPFKPLDIVY